jgi:hypothetical protein
MDVKNLVRKSKDWIQLADCMVKWQTRVIAVMNSRVASLPADPPSSSQ